MGLYIRTRRVGAQFISFSEAVMNRTEAALALLEPFTRLGSINDILITIYKHIPVEQDEPRPLRRKLGELTSLHNLRRLVRETLRLAEHKWRSLYDTYLFIDFNFNINDFVIPAYLAISNGPLEPGDIELDVYPWLYKGLLVVESLEETLEIIDKKMLIKELLLAVGDLQKQLIGRGFSVERAVVAPSPDGLDDMTLARALWLHSFQKILSLALETLQKLREKGSQEFLEVYDYYEPHRRDLIVSMIGNRKEYYMYLRSHRIAEVAKVTEAASVIVESRTGTLESLFRRIYEDILKPYAEEVLETRKSMMQIYTNEFMAEFAERFLYRRSK